MSYSKLSPTHFEQAAAKTRQRIADDVGAVSEDVRPLFRLISRELFDGDFDVNRLLRKCDPSERTLVRFAEQLGTTPYPYIRKQRMETALDLIRETDAKIWQIAAAVGYGGAQGFTTAFGEWWGRAPSEERAAWRRENGVSVAAGSAAPEPARRAAVEETNLEPLCRRALVAAVGPEQAAALIRRLRPAENPRLVLDVAAFLAQGAERLEIPLPALEALEAAPPPAAEPAQDRAEDGEPASPEAAAAPCRSERLSADEEEKLLLAAAAPTLEAIARTEKTVPRTLQPVLVHMREGLFAPGYTVDEIRSDLGVGAWLLASFTREIGRPPWQYVVDARMSTASRLLRDTPLAVTAIGFLVGYADPSSFRRAFKRWTGGLSAQAYRAKARRVVARAGPPPELAVSWWYLEKALAEGPGGEETRELADYLGRVYPSPAEVVLPALDVRGRKVGTWILSSSALGGSGVLRPSG